MTTLTRALSGARTHPASPAHRRAASIIYYDQTQLGAARHTDPEAMAALRAASDMTDLDCPHIDPALICHALTDLGYAPAHAARRAMPSTPRRVHRRRIACTRPATAV